MSYILSINISHNPSVCLLKDDEVVFYGEEPNHLAYESYTEISCIHLQSILDITKSIDDIIFCSYRRYNYQLEQDIINHYINTFIDPNISYKAVHFFPMKHHIYHAMKGLKCSKFTEAAALIADGSGAHLDAHPSYQEIESIYNISSNLIYAKYKHYSCFNTGNLESFFPKLNPLFTFVNNFKDDNDVQYLFSNKLSAGQLFTEASCKIYGGKESKAKELMDLSVSSKKVFAMPEYASLINSCPYLNISSDQVQNMISELTRPEDIAKKIQFETLEHTCNLIQKTIDITGQKNIILSGGYFLNSLNNLEYPKRFPNINFYIDPKAHDGGTAVGAAYYLYKLKNDSTYGLQP